MLGLRQDRTWTTKSKSIGNNPFAHLIAPKIEFQPPSALDNITCRNRKWAIARVKICARSRCTFKPWSSISWGWGAAWRSRHVPVSHLNPNLFQLFNRVSNLRHSGWFWHAYTFMHVSPNYPQLPRKLTYAWPEYWPYSLGAIVIISPLLYLWAKT